jgi:positive regulator of sigma E activity
MTLPDFLLQPGAWLAVALVMIIVGIVGAVRNESQVLTVAIAVGAVGFLVAIWWAREIDRAAVFPVMIAVLAGYAPAIYTERSKQQPERHP